MMQFAVQFKETITHKVAVNIKCTLEFKRMEIVKSWCDILCFSAVNMAGAPSRSDDVCPWKSRLFRMRLM